MRVIAGSLKGRRIEAPPPENLQVRPTSDRAREALFSILQRWPSGAFLDLFSGTGAVALEAYSRGYAPVVALERGEPGWSCLQRNTRGLALETRRVDVTTLGPDAFRNQAVIFADPPYALAAAAWETMAPQIRTWLSPDGVVVWETEATSDLVPRQGWRELEVRDYGRVRFHLLVLEA